MKHWLFICTSQRSKPPHVSSRDIWAQRLNDKYWGLGAKTSHRQDIKENDLVIFYLGGAGAYLFIGYGKVKGPAYKVNSVERKRRRIGSLPLSDFYVDFSEMYAFANEIKSSSLINTLQLFSGRNTSNWGTVLQGGIKDLTESDYNIILSIGNGVYNPSGIGADQDVTWATTEGGEIIVEHLTRERDPRLRKLKLADKSKTEPLRCEVCDFDFANTYGSEYRECCEIHHRLPLSESEGSRNVTMADLAILCANCHRAIHRSGKPIMSVDDFREKVLGR